MVDETPKKRWVAIDGVNLNADYDSVQQSIKPQMSSEVEVFELTRSVDIGPKESAEKFDADKKPYGLPISAKLAIALIADLQFRLRGIQEWLKQEFKTEGFLQQNGRWLEELLIRSSAITIDKNVLLKTLSQPGCEGVRFYLCRKVVEHEVKDEQKAIDDMDFLSLVTVGVTADGQDLLYEYNDQELKQGMKSATLEDTSLLSEYGSPPPSGKNSTLDASEFDDRYAILKYALDLAEKGKK